MQSRIRGPVEQCETPPAVRAGKYLIFQLAREEYAIRVLQVREIRGLQHVTAVPRTPCDVKGVINLLGKVIPVIDLRIKFGLPDTEFTHRTCIVIVRLEYEAAHVGMIVDEVCEVLYLREDDIQDTPHFGGGISIPYVSGLAKAKGKVKILVDIDQVMEATDLETIGKLFQQPETPAL